MFYPAYIPRFIHRSFPDQLWRVETEERVLYLTFDDGPVPGITDWVLETLGEWHARASFFVVGENAERHPELLREILRGGHTLGNHSYSHLNGWMRAAEAYLADAKKSQECILEQSGFQCQLFRPPYGRLTPKQSSLVSEHWQVVMMDVICGDFDMSLTGEVCLQRIQKHADRGSVILLHDSEKAEDRIRYLLPRLLKYYGDLGFRFEALPNRKMQKEELAPSYRSILE